MPCFVFDRYGYVLGEVRLLGWERFGTWIMLRVASTVGVAYLAREGLG